VRRSRGCLVKERFTHDAIMVWPGKRGSGGQAGCSCRGCLIFDVDRNQKDIKILKENVLAQ